MVHECDRRREACGPLQGRDLAAGLDGRLDGGELVVEAVGEGVKVRDDDHQAPEGGLWCLRRLDELEDRRAEATEALTERLIPLSIFP